MKHKHAENMALYAQDAMETDKPWELWEMRLPANKTWSNCTDGDMHFSLQFEYRRKPKIVSVTLENGETVSWPEPERRQPNLGFNYFHIQGSCTVKQGWFGDNDDMDRLDAGIVHLTYEAACKHRDALLKINNQGLEP